MTTDNSVVIDEINARINSLKQAAEDAHQKYQNELSYLRTEIDLLRKQRWKIKRALEARP